MSDIPDMFKEMFALRDKHAPDTKIMILPNAEESRFALFTDLRGREQKIQFSWKDIRDCTPEMFLGVFSHELGHAVLGHDGWKYRIKADVIWGNLIIVYPCALLFPVICKFIFEESFYSSWYFVGISIIVFLIVFGSVSSVIARNSRRIELDADRFAAQIGHGEGLFNYIRYHMSEDDYPTGIMRHFISHPPPEAMLDNLEGLLSA